MNKKELLKLFSLTLIAFVVVSIATKNIGYGLMVLITGLILMVLFND